MRHQLLSEKWHNLWLVSSDIWESGEEEATRGGYSQPSSLAVGLRVCTERQHERNIPLAQWVVVILMILNISEVQNLIVPSSVVWMEIKDISNSTKSWNNKFYKLSLSCYSSQSWIIIHFVTNEMIFWKDYLCRK